jgi:exodeoxyribonuclease V beta subunit
MRQNKTPMIFEVKEYDITSHAVIEASAGTGKTTAIVELLTRLVEDEGVSLSRILITTFTNKATQELRSRIFKDLSKEWLDQTKEQDLNVFSLHSFFYSHTKLKAPLEGGVVDKENETLFFVRKAKKILYTYLQEQGHDGFFDKKTFNKLLLLRDFSFHYFNENEFFNAQKSHNKKVFLQEVLKSYSYYYSFEDGLKSSLLKPFLLKKEELDTITQESSKLFKALKDFYIKNEEFLKSLDGKWSQKGRIYFLDPLILFSKINIQSITDGYSILKPLLEKKIRSKKRQQFWEELSFKDCINKTAFKTNETDLYEKMTRIFSYKLALFKWIFLKLLDYYEILQYQVEVHVIEDLVREIYQTNQSNKTQMNHNEAIHLVNKLAYEFKDYWENRYDYVFIDEFQDSNLLEWETLKCFFLNKNSKTKVCLVADPKQAIYQFKGSDVNAYFEAKKELCEKHQAKSYILATNYRTHKNLVVTLNTVFSHPRFFCDSYEKEEQIISFTPVSFYEHKKETFSLQGKVPFFTAYSLEEDKSLKQDKMNSKQQLSIVCATYLDKIKALQKLNPFLKIGVLAITNVNLDMMEDMLSQAGINCIQNGKRKVFLSALANNLFAVLFSLTYEASEADVTLAELSLFFAPPENIDINKESSKERFLLLHQYLKDLAKEKRWYDLFFALLYKTSLPYNVSLKDFKVYEQLLETLLLKGENSYRDMDSIIDQFLALKEEENEFHEDNYYKNEGLIKAFPPVELMTVHASKGLEFDAVFLLLKKSSNSSYPHVFSSLGKPNEIILRELTAQEKEKQAQNEEKELKNLYYVAFTRAKQALFFTQLEKNFLSEILDSLKDSLEAQGVIFETLQKRNISFYDNFLQPLIQKNESLPSWAFNVSLSELTRLREQKYKPHSFSSLMRGANHPSMQDSPFLLELEDEEPLFVESFSDEKESPTLWDSLPKGTEVGTLLHDLLQNLPLAKKDLSDKNLFTYLKKKLKTYALEDFSYSHLKKIDENKNYWELKAEIRKDKFPFYFELYKKIYKQWESLNPTFYEAVFFELLQEIGKTVLPSQKDPLFDLLLSSTMQREMEVVVTQKKEGTVLKGIIDFIFLGSNEKFYFLDWKTNTLDSYGQSALKIVVDTHYQWQWKIYLTLMVQFLESYLKDFSYEKHVGGFYYFFVKGLGKNQTKGIYEQKALSFDEFLKIKQEVKELILTQDQKRRKINDRITNTERTESSL